MLERDAAGVLHVVALSGGHDSTILALELAEREPRPYTYVCTPTGDELPEMFAHWRRLGELLGSRIVPVVSYVGLRADEPGRAGGAYSDIDGVEMRFPLREWEWGEAEVQAGLAARGVSCPVRTDCARCYHQRVGEWFLLWVDHRDIFESAIADEQKYGGTYRTPGRDSWPTALADMAKRFEVGDVPERSLTRMAREHMEAGACRVCRM